MANDLAAMSEDGWDAGCLVGAAKVIDGDTIIVAGETIRLHGIDAPEVDQTFWWRGRFMKPWEWRMLAAARGVATGAPPAATGGRDAEQARGRG